MAITAGKVPAILLVLIVGISLAGCGLTQKVKDSTISVTKSIFYKQVKMLHLDLQAREGVNNNANGASLATIVRIYQLRDRKSFDDSDYPSLFADDSQAIKADLIAQNDVRLRPGETVTIDVPMKEDAQFVAIAGMFYNPDQLNNTWRLVLAREELDPDKPRIIEARNNVLTLHPLKDE